MSGLCSTQELINYCLYQFTIAMNKLAVTVFDSSSNLTGCDVVAALLLVTGKTYFHFRLNPPFFIGNLYKAYVLEKLEIQI